MPELVFFRRGEEVLRFALDRPRVVIGRGERSDVVIPDPEVSRQQLVLHVEGSTCLLEDLSGKGTLVGGESHQRTELKDGTDIAIGQWRAIFRERPTGSTAAATQVNGTQTEPPPLAAHPPARATQLRVRDGGRERVLRFEQESLLIGQDPTCEVVLGDRLVSARHLKLTARGEGFHLVDQGSTNGTFLGGVRLFEAVVPLQTTLRLGAAELTLEPLAGSALRAPAFEGMVGSDPSVRHLADLIQRVAPSAAAVLVQGESGTGKELVARAVHARSSRAEKPFVPVNCAAISRELIESELFGHEKGAFTGALAVRKGAFEEADGGTLFLDEIGELPLDLQAKLLRALESGEIKRVGASRPITVDTRIVAATNRDLLLEAREGRFREDLYYRLCVVPLHLPPLRNRRADVAALAEHFLTCFTPRGQTVRFTPAALARLQAHPWPGNIRELKNVVHRALLLRRGPTIDGGDLTFDAERSALAGLDLSDGGEGLTLEQRLARAERQIIEAALRTAEGSKERVAKELGIARSTLFKRLKEWGLTRSDEAE